MTGQDTNIGDLFQVAAFGDKNVGGRTHDEDAILVRPDLSLFCVADGAGGDNAGNIASSVALASVARFFEAAKRDGNTLPIVDSLGALSGARQLSRAVHRAHKEVLEIARTNDRYRGMGTTIVAMYLQVEYGLLHVASVGDSSCFRMRNGNLERLNEDHTLGREVVEMTPDFDDEKAAKLPRNVITRALGMKDQLRVSMRSFDIANGDRFILTSDGVSDVLSDEVIVEALQTTRGTEEHVRMLLRTALALGPDDNCAVVVVSVEAALGVSSIPKLHLSRPLRKQRNKQESVAPEPEIVIIDEEDSWESQVHVVPAPDASTLSDLKAYQRFRKPPGSLPPGGGESR